MTPPPYQDLEDGLRWRAGDGDTVWDQPVAQRADAALVMPEPAALDDPLLGVDLVHGVFLAGPVDPGELPRAYDCSSRPTLTVAGGEVPWWALTDDALTAQLPVATQGTSTKRREALVTCWPSQRASDVGAPPGIPRHTGR
jgi:hypothetical protein